MRPTIATFPSVDATSGQVDELYQELDQNAAIVCQCKSGMRSAKATGFLRGVGFRNVRNLRGGILG